MVTRRTFLITGVAGTAALAGTYWVYRGRMAEAPRTVIDADAAAVLRAVTRVMLAGALPAAAAAREAGIEATVGNVRAAVAGLPPATQHELDQLFTLLASPPGRLLFAGLAADWATADSTDVAAALERLRGSRLALRRSAYDALHQLVLAAWYAQADAWPAIGYPGPPELG